MSIPPYVGETRLPIAYRENAICKAPQNARGGGSRSYADLKEARVT
jgi:hypothetical protein